MKSKLRTLSPILILLSLLAGGRWLRPRRK
jgi:hypothetical protein